MRARGIEKRRIFEIDFDRDDFVGRLARLADVGAWAVYAWALMPNHVHLLVRTGNQPLHRSMRSLLAGYATRFNRRYERAGHLFQNRYESTICEDESYFLTLVRYVHRNPIPSVVTDEDQLAEYAYSGHATLLGNVDRGWQSTRAILERFAEDVAVARLRYASFVRGDDAPAPPRSGLLRRHGSWVPTADLRRGRERFTTHERVLATSDFTEALIRELRTPGPPVVDLESVLGTVCARFGLSVDSIAGPGRSRELSRARATVAHLWILSLGQSGRQLADRLGLSCSAIYEAARRAAEPAEGWDGILRGVSRQPE